MMQGTWTQVPLAAVAALRDASSPLVCRAALYLCAVAPHDKTAPQLAAWLGCSVRHARNVMRELQTLGVAVRPRRGAVRLATLPEMGLSELIGPEKAEAKTEPPVPESGTTSSVSTDAKRNHQFRKAEPPVPEPPVPNAQSGTTSSAETEPAVPEKGTGSSDTTRNYVQLDTYERTAREQKEQSEEEHPNADGMEVFIHVWSEVMSVPLQQERIPSPDWQRLIEAMEPYSEAHRRAIVRHYLASDGPPGETGGYADLYRRRGWRPKFLVNNIERHAEATSERVQLSQPIQPAAPAVSMDDRLIAGLESAAASHRSAAAREAYAELLSEVRNALDGDGRLRPGAWQLLDEAFLNLLTPRLSQPDRAALRAEVAGKPKHDRLAAALGWVRRQGIATPMDLAAAPEPHHAEAAE